MRLYQMNVEYDFYNHAVYRYSKSKVTDQTFMYPIYVKGTRMI